MVSWFVFCFKKRGPGPGQLFHVLLPIFTGCHVNGFRQVTGKIVDFALVLLCEKPYGTERLTSYPLRLLSNV
jgi:hypothetical protein